MAGKKQAPELEQRKAASPDLQGRMNAVTELVWKTQNTLLNRTDDRFSVKEIQDFKITIPNLEKLYGIADRLSGGVFADLLRLPVRVRSALVGMILRAVFGSLVKRRLASRDTLEAKADEISGDVEKELPKLLKMQAATEALHAEE